MIKNFILIIFIMALISLTISAQETWTNYTKKDGFPSKMINTMVEDSQGNLWFGTYGGGVSKFDGSKWTNYSKATGFPSNNIEVICEDKQGNMWFGDGGVIKYDGKQWVEYSRSDGLDNIHTTTIFSDSKGNVWFGRRANQLPVGGLIASEIYSSLHRLIGVFKYDDDKFTQYSINDGLVSGNITCMEEDDQGNLWFGHITEGLSLPGGVSKYDGENWSKFNVKSGLISNNVYVIFNDSKGNLWFGTDKGINKYDGAIWTSYNTENGLANNIVVAIEEDKQGNIWASGNRISMFDGTNWTKITDKGAPKGARLILNDSKGNLWFLYYLNLGKYVLAKKHF
jgi:ligand-binding sensor domain-containing protein